MSSRKPSKRKATTQPPRKRAPRRRQVRRGTSPSHMLMSPQDESKFSTPQALTIPGRVQVDLLLRAGSAMYFKPREVQLNQTHVWVGQDYETTEYTSLDMLRSPFRASTIDKWSPKEIALFEACICAWGKDFHCISQHVRTKTTQEVVEFYYKVWKHTQHYYVWKAHKIQCEQLALLKEQQTVQQQQSSQQPPPPNHKTLVSIDHQADHGAKSDNPMLSLLAPHSANYAKRLNLLQQLVTDPNSEIPSTSPLYSLLPPETVKQLTHQNMLKNIHGTFKAASPSGHISDKSLNTEQQQQETIDTNQSMALLKRGWTRETSELAQSIANPNMSTHHIQYHTSSNNPHNPTVTAREGSTSYNIYPSSNPYHLASKPIRHDDFSNPSMHPYDITTGATATSFEHTGGVAGWSDIDTHSTHTLTSLTTSKLSTKENTKENRFTQPPTRCELCHTELPSALHLYNHIKTAHRDVYNDQAGS